MRKSTFAENPQLKMDGLKKQKHGYIIYTWSDKAVKCTFVNLAVPSLPFGSLEIML